MITVEKSYYPTLTTMECSHVGRHDYICHESTLHDPRLGYIG